MRDCHCEFSGSRNAKKILPIPARGPVDRSGARPVYVVYSIYGNTKGNMNPNRFGSFAPLRADGGNQARWYVDGKDYMSAVGDAFASAQHEIFITDWQMNPHIFMKRPDTGVTSLEWRLDTLLKRKANEGVRVYILLYWETKIDVGSKYAASVLSHKNIEVHRHPTYLTTGKHPTSLIFSHHEKIVVVDRSIAFVGGIDLCFGRWDTHSHDLTDKYPAHPSVLNVEGISSQEKYSRWVGKDYCNTFVHKMSHLEEPLKDHLDRSREPRMPWHDVACSFTGEAVDDLVKHFIERYNHCVKYESLWSYTKSLWSYYIIGSLWSYGGDQVLEGWKHPKTQPGLPDGSNVSIQVLRSVSAWSAGQPHEDSIHKAYLHLIENAEHFIYIENQFFISSQDDANVENKIQLALVERIHLAYKSKKKFSVIIFMPLKPEFAGDYESVSPLGAITHWNYATLFSGKDSLFERLENKGVPRSSIPSYVHVYGLRTHDSMGGELVTELIYVHSKIMIVDDRITIIGSANINDRSMRGDRDSEVAVVIEDKDMIDGRMNGETYSMGIFSHGLRCHLTKEHLGLLNEEDRGMDVDDPLASEFQKKISEIASSNTEIYKSVFGGKIIPTNSVHTLDDLKKWMESPGLADTYLEEAREKLKQIRGNIVIIPPDFLEKQNLTGELWLNNRIRNVVFQSATVLDPGSEDKKRKIELD